MLYVAFTLNDHFGRKRTFVKTFTCSLSDLKSACDAIVSANAEVGRTTYRLMTRTEVRSYKYGQLLKHLHMQDAEVEILVAAADEMANAITENNKASYDYDNLESYVNELERLIATTSSIKALRAAVAALKQ